ncbi:Uncharacterised protein [Legionella beliardensis]|uniref:Uncharacterized protein n=1 Tax=Legionella beliardensis TaxID=91822 RepID=A0A378HZ27_9GAMM|nr:hypothetical protein [Legionella beliardensis]STX27993.1 Uncharacterised protein [Legionella beliardensis]
MTADEYLKAQEANKKIYELARNEEERRAFLAKMMEMEMKFVEENVPLIKVNETINNQSLNFTLSPQNKNKLDSDEAKTLFVKAKK